MKTSGTLIINGEKFTATVKYEGHEKDIETIRKHMEWRIRVILAEQVLDEFPIVYDHLPY